MALPNPFYRKTPNTRTRWGYTFEWTEDHLTPEQAHPLKYSYDLLGEECLDRLNAISPPPNGSLPRSTNSQTAASTPSSKASDANTAATQNECPIPHHRDLYALLEEHHASDPKLSELWTSLMTVPDWVSWPQLARGQRVFYRYGGANLTGLAYQSLLGGMGAARVVETLARTGGFSTKVARRRLYETTQHILECTRSLESIQPGGAGFQSSVRVRLLHAAVRQRIMALERARRGYFDVARWGVPINDLDALATIGTFSSTLVWISLPRQGIVLTAQETADYLALWRYVAYLVGCPAAAYAPEGGWFASQRKARALMESLLYYEIEPSPTSQVLASNIIEALADRPPTWASPQMITASARWLNGRELADRLGLARVSYYYWALMAGQCAFFCIMCYSHRLVPAMDEAKIERLKKLFWTIIVDSKLSPLEGKEATFEFKYIPEYDILTGMGKSEDEKVSGYVEKRNARWFVIGIVGMVVVGWGSWKALSGLVRLGWWVVSGLVAMVM